MTDISNDKGNSQRKFQLPVWGDAIPWFLTLASTVIIAGIAGFLVENILWFRDTAFQETTSSDLVYRMHAHHLHIAMIKRSVGLLSGFALLFLGTGVSFYQLRSKSRYKLEGKIGPQSFAAEAVSASPGVLAIFLGVILLLGTIASKDSFPSYMGEVQPTKQGVVYRPPLPSELGDEK